MTTPFTLSPEQRREFLEDGFTRVRGAIPADAAEAMAERIWRAFERRFGFVRDRPETWTKPHAASGAMQPVLAQMANSGAFATMLSATVNGLLDDIFGA